MTKFHQVAINSFLKEREDRFKPEEANSKGLKRLEKIDFSGHIYLAENKDTRTGMILIKKGDLVISGINVEKGAIAVYHGEEDILATIHYSSYSFDKNKIGVEYFKWFLRSKVFKDIVNASIKGGIKTELKPKSFLSLIIPLPDIDIQTEIRKRLDFAYNEMQELEEIHFKNEDCLQNLRQSILSEAVQGKLVPQDPKDEPASELLKKISIEKEKLIKEKRMKKEKPLPLIIEEIPYKLPKGWEWVRFGEITNLGTSEKADSKSIRPYTWVLDLEDIEKDSSKLLQKIRFKDRNSLSTKSIFYKNDVLYGKLRPYLDKVIVADEDGVCTTEILPIRSYFQINPHYIRIYLKNSEFINYVNSKVYGMKMPRLGTEDGRKALFALPPLAEQKRIVKKVDQLMKLCDELEQKVKENQKNSELLMEVMLKEAFENGLAAKGSLLALDTGHAPG